MSKQEDGAKPDEAVNADETKANSEVESSVEVETSEDRQPELNLGQMLEQAQKEASKNYDLALRTQAELENLRRRNTKDVEMAHKFATEKFARELLSIADSMELGLKAFDEDSSTIESLKEGVKLTQQQLFTIFSNLNIEVIDATGTKLNPELHEAMAMVPNSEMEPNTVMEVIQKGYTLNDRLLRPSRVIVTKTE